MSDHFKNLAGEKISHLEGWSKLLESDQSEAISLYATSVSENPWWKHDESTDTTEPIPLSNGTEVYDWLENEHRTNQICEIMDESELKELKKACRLVENHCRSLGKDCQIQFLADMVVVSPPSWPGNSVGDNLFEALQDALESLEDHGE